MGQEFAGRLRARLDVERWTGVPDGAGGFEARWTPSGAVWAEIATAGQRAATEGGQHFTHPRFRAVMREGDLDRSCRLRWGNRVLSVLNVSRDPKHPDRMQLLLEERNA